MDLQDADATTVKYLIRDHDNKYTTTSDTVLADSGITVITTGIRVPRMNAIMERWIRTCRTELLDRTLILHQAHLLHALREYERFYNQHRPHHALHAAAPQRAKPQPIPDPAVLKHLDIQRQRSTRRHPPRVPPRRLTCVDAIVGTYRYRDCLLSVLALFCLAGGICRVDNLDAGATAVRSAIALARLGRQFDLRQQPIQAQQQELEVDSPNQHRAEGRPSTSTRRP